MKKSCKPPAGSPYDSARNPSVESDITSAQQIADYGKREKAYENIVVGLAKSGKFGDARAIALLLLSPQSRGATLARCAIAQAESGDLQGAISTVSCIENNKEAAKILVQITALGKRRGIMPESW